MARSSRWILAGLLLAATAGCELAGGNSLVEPGRHQIDDEFSVDSKLTLPPWSKMILLVTRRPRPVPCPEALVVKKFENIFFFTSYSMPQPVSATS